jgi:hypothetical protein
MYIIIFEDGTIRRTETVEADVLSAADDNYCDVLDVTPDVPLQYVQGEWKELPSV